MIKNIIKYFVIFLLIFIIFYIINKYQLKEFFNNNNNVYFLNKNELNDVLIGNNDGYYNIFYGNDFKARNILNIDDYIKKIIKSISEFNEKQKEKIIRSIKNADKKIFELKIDKSWFNKGLFNKIVWKIGCVKGKLYENGLPHTRGNIIIISGENIDKYNDEKLLKTLIHEKMHIYQKLYKKYCEEYLLENRFERYKIRDLNDDIRANPDLDKWIYKDNNGNILKAKYNNNPRSIEDITYLPYNGQSSEHPYEKMAIDIENML